jgi:hypothetical protein
LRAVRPLNVADRAAYRHGLGKSGPLPGIAGAWHQGLPDGDRIYLAFENRKDVQITRISQRARIVVERPHAIDKCCPRVVPICSAANFLWSDPGMICVVVIAPVADYSSTRLRNDNVEV